MTIQMDRHRRLQSEGRRDCVPESRSVVVTASRQITTPLPRCTDGRQLQVHRRPHLQADQVRRLRQASSHVRVSLDLEATVARRLLAVDPGRHALVEVVCEAPCRLLLRSAVCVRQVRQFRCNRPR